MIDPDHFRKVSEILEMLKVMQSVYSAHPEECEAAQRLFDALNPEQKKLPGMRFEYEEKAAQVVG